MRKKLTRLILLVMLTAGLFVVSYDTSHAGDGTYKPGSPDKLTLNVLFDFEGADFDPNTAWEEALTRTSELLYNSTDGQLQIGTINFYNNCSQMRDKADIIVQSGSGGASAHVGGLEDNNLHVFVYNDTHSQNTAATRGHFGMVHELGHYVFGLYDEYKDKDGNPSSCIDATSTVASIMDGGTTIPVKNQRTEWALAADEAACQNTQQYDQRGMMDWPWMVDYVQSEYGAALTAPDAYDTTMPSGHQALTFKYYDCSIRAVVCLDRSGSMYGTPMDTAKAGANLFIDLTAESDELGVSSFADNASVDYGIHLMSPANKTAAKSIVDGLEASGLTNIGGGLQTSLGMITGQGEQVSNEVIVLLSDGQHNTGTSPTSVIPALVARGVTVYTIGLGSGADASLLSQIASATNGKYFFASGAGSLQAHFNSIFSDMRNDGVIASESEYISYDQVDTYTIPVDAYTQAGGEQTIVLTWDYGTLDLVVRRPDGSVVHDGDPDVMSHLEDTLSELYRLSSPAAGNWMVDVVSISSYADYDLQISSTAKSGVLVTTSADEAQYGYGEPVRIKTSVLAPASGSTQAQRTVGASVSGVVELDGYEVAAITLYDDGDPAHGDDRANDGVYTNYYTAPDEGNYTFSLTVENETGTTAAPDEEYPGWVPQPIDPFTRVSELTVLITPPPPPGDDFDDPGIVDSLPFTVIQDNTHATYSYDDPQFACVSGQLDASIWYRVTPTEGGTLTVSTEGSLYDTVLAVWTGGRGFLKSRACNDDYNGDYTSQVELIVQPNIDYYVEVATDSYYPDSMTLTVSLDPYDLFVPNPIKLKSPADRAITPDTTPSFDWTKLSGADLYHLQVDSDPDFSSPVVDDQTLTQPQYTVLDASPLPYGEYYWRVRGGSTGTWGDWSVVRAFTLTILQSPGNGDFVVEMPTFEWEAVSGAVEYQLQVSDVPEFTLPTVIDETLPGGTSFTPGALAYGLYYWQVRVNTGSGWSEWTPAWMVTVTTEPPSKPNLLLPANNAKLDESTPSFTWEGVTDGDSYQIQIDNNSNFSSPLQDVTLPSGELSYLAAPITEAGKYFWRVRGLNVTGVAGAWSSGRSFVLNGPGTPTLTYPYNNSTTSYDSPTFSWDEVLDADTYQIQISTDKNFVSLAHAASGILYGDYWGATLDDAVYYWRVQAVNIYGVGGKWSKPWRITVDLFGPVSPVLKSPADGKGTTDTTPTFSWKAAKDSRWSWLQISDSPEFTSVLYEYSYLYTSTKLTLPESYALNYGLYYWRVSSADDYYNWGNWSQPFSFSVTIQTVPVNGAETKDTTPLFKWQKVKDAEEYQFQLSTDEYFISPIITESTTKPQFTPAAPLNDGIYYWRVGVDTGAGFDTWMPGWKIVIAPGRPGKPTLLGPANRQLTNLLSATFEWTPVTDGDTFQLQIDDNPKFENLDQDILLDPNQTSYTAYPLAEGVNYWRVRAYNSAGAAGPWSARWQLVVDSIPPETPAIVGPATGARVTNKKLKLEWAKVLDADRYEVQLDTDPAFPLPPIDVGRKPYYKLPNTIGQNVYYWRVRTLDKAGNASRWSDPWIFHLVAGNTVLPLSALDPNLQFVEAESAAVQQAGVWTGISSTQASGGQYLLSSGAANEALLLTFSGTQVAVGYVPHPALGTFAIEIDGMLHLIVDSALLSDGGVWALVSGLTPGEHTLRVYTVTGTAAIDAIAVESAAVPPPSTPVPKDGPAAPIIVETQAPPPNKPTDPTSEPPAEPPISNDPPTDPTKSPGDSPLPRR